jgi:O-antigen/teichoic acid export membrane protein
MLASGLALFSAMFSVNWFLQGLEKMGAFALATLVGRLGSVPATFLLVHKPRDAAIAAAVQAMATCVSAGASIYTASRCAPLWPVRFSPRGAFEQIAGGAHLFLSTAAISLYTYTNILAVGLMAGPAQAGLFDGADRMKRATQVLTGPISNAAFPRINRMMVHERHRVRATMMWLLIVQGGISLALTLGLYVTAPWSTVLLLGRAYASAVPIAQVLSINIFLIGVSNVLGLNMMLPLGMKRAFTTIIVGSGLINLLLLSVLVHPFGALGAAEAVTITEGVVTVGMAAWLIMRGGDRTGMVVASEPDVAVQHSADA